MKNSPRCVIALDVGGSSVKSGIVKSSGSADFVQHTPLNSQASKNKILLVFVKIIKSYLDKIDPGELSGIAFGFPGPFDYENAICFIRGQSKYDNYFLERYFFDSYEGTFKRAVHLQQSLRHSDSTRLRCG